MEFIIASVVVVIIFGIIAFVAKQAHKYDDNFMNAQAPYKIEPPEVEAPVESVAPIEVVIEKPPAIIPVLTQQVQDLKAFATSPTTAVKSVIAAPAAPEKPVAKKAPAKKAAAPVVPKKAPAKKAAAPKKTTSKKKDV